MKAQSIYIFFILLLVSAVLMVTLGVREPNPNEKRLRFSIEEAQNDKTMALTIAHLKKPYVPRSPLYPLVIYGHRGAGALEPENTIKSDKRAIELGLDSIELDVWLTKDGVPIISHDNVNRFGQHDYLELRQMTQESGRYLLSLAEVLDVCKDKIKVNIELKDPQEIVVMKVLDVVAEKDMLGQVMFSSFHHYLRGILTREVERRNLNPKVYFGFLNLIFDMRFPKYDMMTQPGDEIVMDFRYLVNHREKCIAEIKKAREHGVNVTFWFYAGFANEHLYYEDLVTVGVRTIITNYPLAVLKHFENKKVTEVSRGEDKA